MVRSRLSANERVALEAAGYRRAAVLLLLCPGGEEPLVLLTKRTEEVETHKGQISLPGGVMDDGDADLVATALREAGEEVGVGKEDLIVAGMLDDHVTPTGFVITPVVAVCRRTPRFTPNPREVAEVLQVPLRFFADRATVRTEERIVDGRPRTVYFYQYGGEVIWGATAAIIRQYLERTAGAHDARANSSPASAPTA